MTSDFFRLKGFNRKKRQRVKDGRHIERGNRKQGKGQCISQLLLQLCCITSHPKPQDILFPVHVSIGQLDSVLGFAGLDFKQ